LKENLSQIVYNGDKAVKVAYSGLCIIICILYPSEFLGDLLYNFKQSDVLIDCLTCPNYLILQLLRMQCSVQLFRFLQVFCITKTEN